MLSRKELQTQRSKVVKCAAVDQLSYTFSVKLNVESPMLRVDRGETVFETHPSLSVL